MAEGGEAAVAAAAQNVLVDYMEMYSHKNRLMTFVDWPFLEDCLCTPEMMARAGFVHCPSENEPDVVRCFFCLTELEGWEPQDDPWLEHSKRNPKCGFLQLKKDYKELLVDEYFMLEMERLCIYIRKKCRQQIQKFEDEVELTRKNLETLFKSTKPTRVRGNSRRLSQRRMEKQNSQN
ncbi:baculoviral IAP repeat-containing protein 5-like isoform X1 [Erpetoichthys calabaricus]|uniref:baculoviral IAP repeat-containing protein 5-like isoform X1 n=1 Tax=Erpetoichthys calabaricus TaxID=27687 RepID=UPI00223447B7|nr:baculoviral IAP repeat-containing protein 5-like isoform X1 [Erpetoichthys calabaricus]